MLVPKIVHLDFVFGDVMDGTLYPLDGLAASDHVVVSAALLSGLAPAESTYHMRPSRGTPNCTMPHVPDLIEFCTVNLIQYHRPDMGKEPTVSMAVQYQARLPAHLEVRPHHPGNELVVLDSLHQH